MFCWNLFCEKFTLKVVQSIISAVKCFFFFKKKTISILIYSMFGWIVNSSPPEEGAIGATLEIQRSQQMEAIEQQFMQQQNRVTHRMPNARSN